MNLQYGEDKYSDKYYYFDFYPGYFDYEADIPGYSPSILMQLSRDALYAG
ncbi:hypothetical protein G3I44_08185 [Halogeometricum borinquense]|uniref:Uncharacterized protein n=1 Tax=Halogeometricum borinquense TaxID=60847 RepID=A0A6C0UCI8_9EURY|nr:hypothetical protein [Halogeometricum borinquense]QIB72797.1 hypothetical protein G3I44_08185 [Halogeometricum borinquense]